jgi:hypothetical protein
MKQKKKGFILVLTLVITGIISLLTLTGMQHLLLYYKAMNHQEKLQDNFYQLEKVALELAHQPVMPSTCIDYIDNANQVLDRLLHQQGCSREKDLIQYQYYIEDLVNFPCLVIQQKTQKFASHHQRITVMSIEEGFPLSLLQIRWVSVGEKISCNSKENRVSLGVSSWRYLPSL